jgi:hypothetical protein
MSDTTPTHRSAFDRCGRCFVWTGLAACALAAPWAVGSARVQDVFVGLGEHGEMSFSDEASPGARRVSVTVPEPAAGAVEETERRIEQTLRVAKALEQSRLAREEARARARQRPAAVAPAVYGRHVQNDYPAYYFARSAYPHWPSYHQPPHSPGAELPTGEPAILTAPLLRRGATQPDRSNWLRKDEG